MRILITGGAGFIGSTIATYHLKKKDEVIVIDNLSTGHMDNIKNLMKHPDFSFYKKNLLTWKGLSQVLQNVDRVYHFAAIVGMFHVISHPMETLQVNINATMRLLETIKKIGIKPLVIVASSSEVYGSQHRDLHEGLPLILENTQTNHAAYAISKLCDESIAMAFWHKFQIPTMTLRIFNTVGRNQSSHYGMVVPRLIKQAVNNENITVFGDGMQRRSFCNVIDTVNLITLLAENRQAIGEIINVGNNDEISINNLAIKIKELCASHSSITHTPFEEVYQHDYMHITERKPDLTKLLSLTHYTYQWNLEQTILDISSYYKERVICAE